MSVSEHPCDGQILHADTDEEDGRAARSLGRGENCFVNLDYVQPINVFTSIVYK